MRRVCPTVALKRLGALCLAAAVGVGGTACGDTSEATPVACLDGKGAYLGALGEAPGEVLLSGEVPISDCLAENQPGGELATVGATMVAVATELSSEARAEPGGDASLQLGYLVGAARRGAEGSEGIHADLVRRLEAAAGYSPGERPLPASFLRAYREGLDAGSEGG